MSYLTPTELLSVELALPQDTPYLFNHVSQTQLSIARHYGGIKYQGKHYAYMPLTDELVRATDGVPVAPKTPDGEPT